MAIVVTENNSSAPAAELVGVRRPAAALLWYYVLTGILTGPFMVFVLPYRFFRYRTLRYTFDLDGLTVRWGMLFRREISLGYARIQDIHLVSNLIERWLGLGRVQIQTASGNAGAEVTIEGLRDFEALRDALYQRMRGARHPEGGAGALAGESMHDVVVALRAATGELAALRQELERQSRA